MQLILEDDFRDLIPNQLSEEEYNQLEENSIKETKPEESIVLPTWNGILLDGYPLYEICQKHNLKFRNVEKQFTDQDEAKLSVINHHLAMPTYPAFVKIELALKKADILQRIEQGKQKMVEASHPKKITCDAFQTSVKQPNEIGKINVTKEIAQEIKVSTDTVSRGKYLLKNASEAVKQNLRTGKLSINEGYLNEKKKDKELERLKNGATNESDLQKLMRGINKDVRSKKIMTKFFKEIPFVTPEHLKLMKARIEQELSNSDPTQPSATTDSFPMILLLLPAPTPTLLLTAPET